MSAAVMHQPQQQVFEANPDASYVESNQSQDISEEQWRGLAQIVRDVGPTLMPDEEIGDLAAAEAAVNAKESQRNITIERLREEVRHLTRQHQSAAAAAQRPSSHPSPAEHDGQVRSLEQQQYSIGKALNEERALVAKKEVELGRVKSDKEEIGKSEVGEDDWVDGKAIRLKLMAEAGFSLIPAKDDGAASKVLIRNDAKEDVHTVPVEKNRSRVYYANLIWSLASE